MEVSVETKLKRFLLYASGGVVYVPGSRLQRKFYENTNLDELRSLLADLDKAYVFKTIKWFHDENLSPHPEVIPFVLSECCRIPAWRSEALKLVEGICSKVEMFLLFFKFAFEITPKLGTGRACKRLIKNWYSKKDCLELAEIIGQTPKYRGWRHGDLIKLAHLKSDEPARSAIYTFATKGVEAMKEMYAGKEEATQIVSYLSTVQKFRQEKDVNDATRTIESYMLTIHHLNHIHRKSKKVWKALLPQMSLADLLNRLHLLSKYGMFRALHLKTWDQNFNPYIFDRMSNTYSITASGIEPSRVCLELYRYQNEPAFKLQTAIKKNKKAKRVPQPFKELITTLEDLMAASFVNIKPTGLNYTVIIDNFKIQSRRCAYRGYVSPHVAAAVIALSIKKAGGKVKIVTFEGKTVESLDKEDYTVASLSSAICSIPTTKPSARSIANYCSITNPEVKDTDVFILLANTVKFAKYKDVVKQHKKENPLSPKKFVFCSLCGLKYAGTIKDGEDNALLTSGFNDKLFQLINSFGKTKKEVAPEELP